MYSSDESQNVYNAENRNNDNACVFDKNTMYSEYRVNEVKKTDISLSECENNVSKTDVIEQRFLEEDYYTEEPNHTEDECNEIPIIFVKAEMQEKQRSDDDEGEIVKILSEVIHLSSEHTTADEAMSSSVYHSSPKV